MFDAAKGFVIQNGVFIEVVDSAKAYAKRLSKLSDSKSGRTHLDARYSKYRRIRKGDIKLVDFVEKHWSPDASDDAYDDYIVEVAGENRTRMARFYQGRNPHKRFEMEMDLISNLSHPRIAQVFGVCYPMETPGIVLHDDGTLRGFSEFAMTLQSPLQRAAFCIKYAEEYADATNYLYQRFQDHEFLNESKIYCSMFNEEHSLVAECFVDSCNHLTIMLAIGTPVVTSRTHRKTHGSYANPDRNWDVLNRKMARPLRHDMDLIQSTFNTDKIHLQTRSQRLKHISTWQFVLMHSRRVYTGAKLDKGSALKLGQPVWMRIFQEISRCHSNSSLYYIPGDFEWTKTTLRHVFKPNIVWTLVNHLQQSNKLSGGITRFTFSIASLLLRPPSERRITITGHLCIDGNHICRAWLSQAPKIKRDLRFPTIPGNQLGIVSDGKIDINIDFNCVALLHLWRTKPNAEIKLLVSDPEVDYKDGTINLPSVWWESNLECNKFSDHILRQILSFEISVQPIISYWNTFVYEAMHELYKKCDLEAPDVCNLLGLPKFNQKTQVIRSTKNALYIEDVSVEFLLTDHEKDKDSSYGIRARKQSLSSLSWIGVTILEDYGYIRLSSDLLGWGSSRNTAKKYADDEWEDVAPSNPSNSLIHDRGELLSESLEDWEDVWI